LFRNGSTRRPERRQLVAQNAVPDFDPERLRRERTRAGLTQRGLEDKAGLPHGVVAMYENGFRGPGIARLLTLAAALDVDPEDLTFAHGAETLARLRVRTGLTQAEAAAAAGMVRTTYSALERGEHATIAPDVVSRIAAVFGVTVEEVRSAHAHAQAVADRLAAF